MTIGSYKVKNKGGGCGLVTFVIVTLCMYIPLLWALPETLYRTLPLEHAGDFRPLNPLCPPYLQTPATLLILVDDNYGPNCN